MLPFASRSLLALIAVLAVPASASAATVVVNPGDDVQAKVDTAAAGDTVLFKAGAHTGTVATGTADLTLKGEPGAFLVNGSGATAPTIAFTGSASTVSDLTVISTVSDGVRFGTGAGQLLRSTVVTLAEAGVAASTTAGALDSARTLTVDSSILVGKTALAASFSAPSLLGSIAVVARHVTAIGALTADGSLSPASTLTFTVTDSLVRGAVGTGVTAETSRNSIAATAADAGSLFVRPGGFNYHLRADAPVVDKGQMTSGESATDVDGDPRVSGSASDYGADEFVNKAPTAALAAPGTAVRQNLPATFDASKSVDPEAAVGGGIARYHWDFGDGTTADTTTPTTTHAFAGKQAYSVTVTVTDKQGASAASSPVAVTVIDGTPPVVRIGQPGAKQRITLYSKKKKAKRLRVTLFGNATDDVGLGKVYLTLRPVATKGGKCRWFDGKRRLRSGDCTVPILLTAKLSGGSWRYALPLKAKLPRGPYQLAAIAVDASGLPGAAQTVSFRFR